jgi:hypothetical protein
MIARVPGLVAHAVEEQARERPMRRIDPVNHVYDGPAPRPLPGLGAAPTPTSPPGRGRPPKAAG